MSKPITYFHPSEKPDKHPKCLSTYDAWNGDYDCEYSSNLTCEECKYGVGTKDPEAKCNHIKEQENESR